MILDCFEYKFYFFCMKMNFQNIVTFLYTTSDDNALPRFVTKKWIEVYDQSEGNYNVNKEIRIKTSMLRSDLCDFNDAYIVVKGIITVGAPNNAKNNNSNNNKAVAFKSNAPFINCISKINDKKIDNVEDLDVVMPIYNLLEYSKNYKKQQVVCGVITGMNQAIHFLLILNLLNIKQALQEILIMLVMVKKGMMQIKLVKMKLKLLFHENI